MNPAPNSPHTDHGSRITELTSSLSAPAPRSPLPAPAPLLLVDGHAYAYRAFHAVPRLTSPTGAPTNAILGFIRMLGKLVAKLKPMGLVVVWDGGLAAERLAALPEYKAQRPEMPVELDQQLGEIHAYLEAAQLAAYCQEGIEADDAIASLAKRLGAAVDQTVIASSDKDFMQLVSAQVGLLNPNDKSGQIWSAEQVRAKTGVAPEQIVDWLSLVGDAVDNIPGVPGVGPKTASKLLQQFGSCVALYGRLAQIEPERLRQALRASEGVVTRNRQLIRLNYDLPCPFTLAGVAVKPGDVDRLRELYQKWGFHTLLKELETAARPELKLW